MSDHASFYPADPVDEDEFSYDSANPSADSDTDADEQAAARLILAVIGAAAGGYVLIRKATPHVQRMIQEGAFPAVRSFWKKVSKLGIKVDPSDADGMSLSVVSTPHASKDAAASGTVAKSQMSPDEWYARFRAMLEEPKFADEQWAFLSSVQVADDEAIGELQREMARNGPEAVVRQVPRMLEAAPEIDTEAEAETETMPIEVERVPEQHP